MELRFENRAARTGNGSLKMKPILQYRVMERHMGGENQGNWWSEWKDVPTVERDSEDE